MSRDWQLQNAKDCVSDIVEGALRDGPQHIMRRGKDVVVVMSAKDYYRLKRGKTDLVSFFRASPLRGLRVERQQDIPRPVEI